MARHKNPNNKNQKQKNIVAGASNLIVRAFSPIGNIIILCFRVLFSTLRRGAIFLAHGFFALLRFLKPGVKKIASLTQTYAGKSRESLITYATASGAFVRVHVNVSQSVRTAKKECVRFIHLFYQTVMRLKLPHMHLPAFPVKLRLSPLTDISASIKNRYASREFQHAKSFIAGVILTLFFVFIPYSTYRWVTTLPNPELLSRRDLEVTTKIFDRNGNLLYEIYADQNRTPLRLADIPDSMKQATIAIEDREFYQHQGFSIKGIIRASKEMFTSKRVVQGGSTITQQLIKSALLSPDISFIRKMKEIILAFWAERLYTKNQILEMYLNQVPYGGTAWGGEAASRTYFGKPMKNLSLAETALLAGLPAAPSDYSPYGSHPEKAFDRQAEVLRRMVEDRYITREQARDALAQELHFIPPRVSIRAPHFVMYVKELLEKQYGSRLVEKGGLRIVTSLDIGTQEKVQEILRKQIESLKYLRVGNGGALVTNPKTGEILAMVGSKDYFNSADQGNVNVTTSLRQPGSSIKVVNYAAALENGFTASTVIDDSPITYQSAGTTAYSPVNYDSKFHGLTPLRYALGNSYNIPAVKVLAKIGLKTMIDKGRLMGIESWEDESRFGLSLTLGGGEVTMLEMAEVFGTLANSGKRNDVLPILEVTDYTGKVIERNVPRKGIKATTPETAWIMSNILSDNNARVAAFGPNSSLVIPGKTVSVKTGTSNDKRDNWTVGYTPSLVTTVWVGNNDNSPMDPYLTSGITGAAPIWHDIMVELLKNKQDEIPPRPDTIVSLPCYFDRPEYYVRGTEPAGGRCAPLPTPTPSPSPTP
ncbi:transglycosylase domain-containing protein [Candidatus Gottesmanbacteria bacterium]|nr:transglycosylase domain-containing protein [Candidatus Gottesmanbacteria bacterium]